MTTSRNTVAALGSLILVTMCLFALASPAQAGLGYGRQAPPAADISADDGGLPIGERIQRQEKAMRNNEPKLTNQDPTPGGSSDPLGSWWVGAAAMLLAIAAAAALIRAARKPSAQTATGPGGR